MFPGTCTNPTRVGEALPQRPCRAVPDDALPYAHWMVGQRVLVLAGTTEARLLAQQLTDSGIEVVVSLAGRTAATERLAGETRSGGFGGVSGLSQFVRSKQITAVVCATHPFAAIMPFHAAAACASTSTPLLRLLRPAWSQVVGDRWITVADLRSAARALVDLGARRVLLTTGRQELRPFADLGDIAFTIRSIEPPDVRGFTTVDVVLDRGPFTVDGEHALLVERSIDVVVSKNSGGSSTAAKLVAAREAGIPVVMVARPPGPDMTTVMSVDAAVVWLERNTGSG